jgi:cytidylate kinase
MLVSQAHVITIDGPSGVGKGTISQYLAAALGWHYLDSGALYRILGYAANRAKVDLDNADALLELMDSLHINFSGGAQLNGESIDERIRTEQAGERASRVAQHPQIRSAMLELQRGFLKSPGLVADGRDMGTTIFPQTPHKFYLTASAEERANRRYKQLKEKGQGGNIGALFRDIQQRDDRDMNRADSPLRPADDASIIDTSNLSISEVLEKVMEQLPFRAIAPLD